MLNVKKLLTKVLMRNLSIQTVSNSTAVSVPANGGTQWAQVRCPSTIKPIAVVGYYLDGGYGCSVYNASLAQDSQGYYASYALRNGSSSVNSVKVSAHFLYWGGFCVTSIMSTISRLAERRWEYAEREETSHKVIAERIKVTYHNKFKPLGICKCDVYQNWKRRIVGYFRSKYSIKSCGGERCDIQDSQSARIASAFKRCWVFWIKLHNSIHYYGWKRNSSCDWVPMVIELQCGRNSTNIIQIASTSERGWSCA